MPALSEDYCRVLPSHRIIKQLEGMGSPVGYGVSGVLGNKLRIGVELARYTGQEEARAGRHLY